MNQKTKQNKFRNHQIHLMNQNNI